MKKSDKQELRAQSISDLEAGVEEAYQKLFKLKTHKSVQKKAERAHEFKKTRQQIARMKTFIQEKGR
jgi:ribosomal protein L29